VTEVLAAIPYAQFLGVQVEQVAGTWRCVLPFRQEIVGNPRLPAIHGGVLGAFLELTAFLRLYAEAAGERAPKPINFTADYLRSAGPQTTYAEATIFKLGRRIATVHVVAWQDDCNKPVASGNGKFRL
jgi:uncharacterized protein (TIGR00369 family)